MFVQCSYDLVKSIKNLATTKMGSFLHGTNTDESDIDFFNLYTDYSYSNFKYDFGLQYKTNESDYNYQEIRSFVYNLIKGESPAYFEILYSNDFNNITKPVNNLINILKQSYKNSISYNLIKSYTGYMKKDFERFSKIDVDCYQKRKYSSHIVRVRNIIDYLVHDINIFTHDNKDLMHIVKDIKLGNITYNETILKQYLDESISIRNTVFNNIGKDNIFYTISNDDFLKIAKQLQIVINDYSNDLSNNKELCELKYKTMENGLTFQYI